jgi:hypothetical protein
MKLTRQWHGRIYDIPCGKGSSDSYTTRGEYLVVWNTTLGYWAVMRFDKETFHTWWSNQKVRAMNLATYRISSCEPIDYIAHAQDILEDALLNCTNHTDWWSTYFSQGDGWFSSLIELVPENKRHYYGDSASIVKDYPHKAIELVADCLD